MPSSMEKGINEVQTDDDSNCSHDNDSEEEVPDESDDDGYNRYDGYDEWGNCDRGYYYRDRRRERKTSPMMSPIISPISCKRHPYIPPQAIFLRYYTYELSPMFWASLKRNSKWK
ncbi:unnamed protein product [Rhizophagus irregularis]|nr:unnamed protein product [Rhizophagus irregularis]